MCPRVGALAPSLHACRRAKWIAVDFRIPTLESDPGDEEGSKALTLAAKTRVQWVVAQSGGATWAVFRGHARAALPQVWRCRL